MRGALRTTAVRTAFGFLAAVGAPGWLGHRAKGDAVVLMMHRVRPALPDSFRPNAHLEITPEYLDVVLQRLRTLQIPVVPLREARERLSSPGRERFAVLTFDDGYRDNLDHAYPILRRHQAPFTVFVATGMVDGTSSAWWMALEEIIRRADAVSLREGGVPVVECRSTPAKSRAFFQLATVLWDMVEADRDRAIRALAAEHGVDLRAMLKREMMDWEDLRRLSTDPLAEIGGHTIDHPALAQLDGPAAEAEVRGGLDRIEAELGFRPTSFAYPYGRGQAVSRRDQEMVARLGIDIAVTTERGMVYGDRSDPLAWPRASLNGNFQSEHHFNILVSGAPFMLDEAARRLFTRRRPRHSGFP